MTAWRERSGSGVSIFRSVANTLPTLKQRLRPRLTLLKAPFYRDAGDNVTAGAPGDNTLFLKTSSLEADIPNALVSGLTDAENTQACFKAGLGEQVTLTVGGKLDSKYCSPLKITGTIVNLYEPADLTLNDVRTATLDLGKVTLILTEQPWGFTRLHQFTDAGVNPLDYKIIVMKVGYNHPESWISLRGVLWSLPRLHLI